MLVSVSSLHPDIIEVRLYIISNILIQSNCSPQILEDEPDLTEEEVTGKKSKIVVYMEKFMKEGNEDDKEKLDRHATLVLSKALLNDNR